jgi:hypothetical protein
LKPLKPIGHPPRGRHSGQRNFRAVAVPAATLPIREEIAVLSIFYRLMKCEGGATALEYMLIAALVGLAAFQVTEKMAGSPMM